VLAEEFEFSEAELAELADQGVISAPAKQ